MKVIYNGQTIDPAQDLVLLVFDNDSDRLRMIAHLSGMPKKKGKRVYAIYPETMAPEIVERKAKEAICA